ncbi:MAG: hypothetical protein Q7S41_04830, partial [Candidatus Limnocylindria bacterium]|nr:hypothetical protein [Candidatus Limnocylindria bacterium]
MAAHAVVAALAAVELVRALHQPWLRESAQGEASVFAWAIVLPIASALVSVLAVAVAARSERSSRAFAWDLASLGALWAIVFVLSQSEHLPSEAALGLLAVALLTRAAALAPLVDLRLPSIDIADGRRLLIFIGINALIALVLVGWPLPAACDLGCSMRARWIPFGIALATALTLALSRGVPSAPLVRRHAILWLMCPVAFALTGSTTDPQNIVGLPVVALAVGIALHGVIALKETLHLRDDRTTGRLVGLTVLAASLALMPWVRTVQPTESDEPHYLITMQSLVLDHDLDLRNQYDDADYHDYYPVQLDERHVIGVGTKELPIRDLGLPLLGAIPFALGRRTGVLVLMCLITALFAWRGFTFLRRLGFGRETTLLAVSSVALLHPLLTYTTQIYPDSIGALVMLLVAEQLAHPVTPRRLAIASALLGCLPWLSARHWIIAIGMGLVVAALAFAPLARGRVRTAVPLVLAGAVPFVAVVGAYVVLDYLLFGVAVPNAGYLVIREQYYIVAYTPWVGLPGLLLDRTFGLLSHAPVYGLAFLGLVPLARRWSRARSPAIAALFLGWLLYLLYIADIYYWWADGSPPSRYQVASIAFLLVALAAGLEQVRGAVSWALIRGAVAWSAAVTVVYLLAPNVRYDVVADIQPGGGPGFLWGVVTRRLR